MIPPRYLWRFLVLLILGVGIFLFCRLPYDGPLEAYLNEPPVIHNTPWDISNPPEKTIPLYLKRFNDESASSREKGIALANLGDIAFQMSKVALARKAAKDLLENVVMPNLDYTRAVETTNHCSWRHTLLYCKSTYKNLGNFSAARECLELLHAESDNTDDQDLAIYRLAYEYVNIEDYHSAIETIERLPAHSRWTAPRPELISIWTKKMIAADSKASELRLEQSKLIRLFVLTIAAMGGGMLLCFIIWRINNKHLKIAEEVASLIPR